MNSFYHFSFSELKSLFIENDLNPKNANKLFNWHYKKKKVDFCRLELSKNATSFVQKTLNFSLPEIQTLSEAKDGTVKFLFKLSDGNFIETVLIPFHNKYSICLSSQVGCAMKCSFCYTGTQGLKRNLETNEITGQFIKANAWLHQNRPNKNWVSNIVFMGQGEPLHNFENVKKACEIFLTQSGASIAPQKITVSTSGYLPGLKKWLLNMPPVNLALSLHSPYREKRDKLIPINRVYPLHKVLDLIDQIPLSKKQFITYEYLLIDGFNDHSSDAHSLGKLIEGKRAYINLIPFNPFPESSYRRPSDQTVSAFKKVLDGYGIPTLIRTTKGDEVMAACGQLKSNAIHKPC